ncbi:MULTISPECIES: IclR family transcriptional regulator [Desulfobacula]|uniref:Transcriptional regulator, IclR family n=2 Tax=Desulfobacula TaxID=28222 RepID=K0NHZ7_DESTT|nr:MULTISPECIES: IclR family transcriptional regulator [Desulfobacula]CCK78592.1 transcriptional regulator, IclR family [Desulfobacula toluolica Tol2]SDT89508.1 transcriptional regulator, IclR family [Desulfobacula phenolica]
MTKKYQAPIVKKAFIILDAISKSSQGLRISEISNRLDISKSTVHGITAALEDQGAIIRDSISKRYTIGITLMELGKAAYERIDFKNIAKPIMEELMEQCQESVFLGVRNGDSATIIDIVESRKDLKISSPIGTSLPLVAGAIGKTFLSLMEPKDLKKYLDSNPLVKFTPNTIMDKNQYTKELEKVRDNGFATDDEEYILGVRAAAAPIKRCGAYTPAIWVVGFKASMSDKKIQIIIEQTKTAADRISKKLSILL